MDSFGIGIESSCDETSVAIVKEGRELLSLKIYSQIESHAPYRGVVPELASRSHLEKINLLLEECLEEANVSWEQIKYVAVSAYPGLMGSLMIGAQLARCISLVHSLPIVLVNHLEAHLAVVGLEEELPEFPVLGVLLSGGNSSVYLYHDFGKMELIGDTMDDSLGEAFDKVSSLLDLPYPGGPPVEKEAVLYESKSVGKLPSLFPKLLKESGEEIQFSFSGLKTAVLYHVKSQTKESLDVGRVCSDFQKTAFELVIRNIRKAVKKTGIRTVICAGGVLANGSLRNELELESKRQKWKLFYPRKKIHCTDNGAMVASLGYHLWKKGYNAPLNFKVSPKRNLTNTI
ncbi:tRNA (adenosine(37)-N6)-threonylcarbamoyltransferase complex transferase subunit TsaD [Leptospira idonii]|uniref:tRNA N6-adenosine threonylcarbamoyltransferase n=1 Tax=Leptospira idonii TaxID=1193500 RepID=A0A4R9M2E2_9LEPT|nr:tRNA (adenosine(37)-N6)-threonylcarbamoyltransferase complex transferase subunit TsaD [Leptospira idonii]TGN20141.1 tRNA (adenosine(37)-N6)-threonylcarbamoyltransferase complex transferase subunit TsaD [Leptospira idonii]